LKLTVHCCAQARYAKCVGSDSRFADTKGTKFMPGVMPGNSANGCLFFAVAVRRTMFGALDIECKVECI
jgi:hypothetical protein